MNRENGELQTWQRATGERLAWREYGAGPPLVLLHGWSMSSAVFLEIAELLSAEYHLYCPDLPGHGASNPAAECSLTAFAESLEEWLAHLRLTSLTLFGWSLGGQVAMQLAARSVLNIEKLLLVSTTPQFCSSADWQHGLPRTQLRAMDRNLQQAYEKTLGEFFNQQFVDGEVSKERYRQIIKFAVRTASLPATENARECLRILGQTDLRSDLSRISLPTLVLHGESDRIIPVAAGRYLAETLRQASLHLFPFAGHAPFLTRPNKFTSILRNFLG